MNQRVVTAQTLLELIEIKLYKNQLFVLPDQACGILKKGDMFLVPDFFISIEDTNLAQATPTLHHGTPELLLPTGPFSLLKFTDPAKRMQPFLPQLNANSLIPEDHPKCK
jgi:hypothetical protein